MKQNPSARRYSVNQIPRCTLVALVVIGSVATLDLPLYGKKESISGFKEPHGLHVIVNCIAPQLKEQRTSPIIYEMRRKIMMFERKEMNLKK
ncbi:unnamed protein product [Arabidopsis lyrata]|uniref:Predicted protein n=1 Tax=Arabidopsis lyrata subsp. lyrata TaxID=81972 RepID=D7MHI2_ARALL|nr:predicted protein [Arabidopsis lyrata subsp. lyrata]CAH8276849.1 unnamed protein product [Arabidopsis lyrata]